MERILATNIMMYRFTERVSVGTSYFVAPFVSFS